MKTIIVMMLLVATTSYAQLTDKYEQTGWSGFIDNSNWVLGYSSPSQRFYYDIANVFAYGKDVERVWVAMLSLKKEAFNWNKPIEELPIKYIECIEYIGRDTADVGYCTFLCSQEFLPIMKEAIRKAIAKEKEHRAKLQAERQQNAKKE